MSHVTGLSSLLRLSDVPLCVYKTGYPLTYQRTFELLVYLLALVNYTVCSYRHEMKKVGLSTGEQTGSGEVGLTTARPQGKRE